MQVQAKKNREINTLQLAYQLHSRSQFMVGRKRTPINMSNTYPVLTHVSDVVESPREGCEGLCGQRAASAQEHDLEGVNDVLPGGLIGAVQD